MPKKHYEWSIGDPPPELGAHSIAKHEVLAAYLERYVQVLAARPRQDKLKLTLVDGFSGGGRYRHWKSEVLLPGSPLIMLDAMRKAEAAANKGRKKPLHVDVRFLFIDQARSAIDFLANELRDSEAAAHFAQSTDLICSPFSQQLDHIIADVKKRQRAGRAIFLLDQYGYTDVPMGDLRRIFKELPKAEVILTIATDWLIDQWQEKTIENVGFEFPEGHLKQIKFDEPNDWRRRIQFELHTQLYQLSGAAHYTPFFIVSPGAHRCYWLLHFSMHPKARDVMMQLHWSLENHFEHYGQPGFHMLGYHPHHEEDSQQGYQGLPFGFDSRAAQISHEALSIELPELVSRYPDGVRFGDFFASNVNHTPATREMQEKAVKELTLNKELELFSEDGKQRKNGVHIRDSDVVRFPKQTRLI